KDSQKPAGWGVREKRVQRGKPKRGEGRRLLYQFFVKALPSGGVPLCPPVPPGMSRAVGVSAHENGRRRPGISKKAGRTMFAPTKCYELETEKHTTFL
ncbi:MAG: hypothetical protein IJ071_08315, partial [Ruminococcus sp.]|nr:hypothetical protein [Ruminococcus sp.]